MIAWIGDNIISSLGFSTEDNYKAVKSGISGLAHYDASEGIGEPYMASLINREKLNDEFAARCEDKSHYTPLEKASILSVVKAAEKTGIDLSAPDVLFILSSTKGNIDMLDEKAKISNPGSFLWYSAKLIAAHFGNTNEPVAVSNACISGLCAQIVAMRELESKKYNYAVVVGVDMLSRFIITGFQSLKALSPEGCRPFDAGRKGLNLGEAATTIIYGRNDAACAGKTKVMLKNGSVRNDANHISGPSRTGEGSYLALKSILSPDINDGIAFINAHGTATPYNDRMEAIALSRAGLNSAPVNSLKGYFGHTLGAAGTLESIVSTQALLDSTVLATLGFEKGEEEYPLNVANTNLRSNKNCYIKIASGFGGCNAALLFKKLNNETVSE